MKTFKEKVYAITDRIPKGKIATYGQIAKLVGNPKASQSSWYVHAHKSKCSIHSLP